MNNVAAVALVFSVVSPVVVVLTGIYFARRRQREFDREFDKTNRKRNLH